MKTVNTRWDFLTAAHAFVKTNGVCVEIGVLHGEFSERILDRFSPEKLILIDPYTRSEEAYGKALDFIHTAYSNEDDYQNLIRKFEKEIYSGQVEVVRKYSYEAVDYVADNSIDFLYHDASHLYDDLKRDLNEWLPKMKEGGIVAGHDYIEHEDFGVIKAVDEFCAEHGYEMIIFNENGGDYALKKISGQSQTFLKDNDRAKSVRDYAYGKEDDSRYKKPLTSVTTEPSIRRHDT